MAPILENAATIAKKLLFFLIFPALLVIFLFFLGEQFEVGRLGAVAACEEAANKNTCLRTKGYLPQAPYYPDLGRRYLGGFARLVGGDLGASYREALPPPAPAEEKSAEAAAPVAPPVANVPPPPPPPLPVPKK